VNIVTTMTNIGTAWVSNSIFVGVNNGPVYVRVFKSQLSASVTAYLGIDVCRTHDPPAVVTINNATTIPLRPC